MKKKLLLTTLCLSLTMAFAASAEAEEGGVVTIMRTTSNNPEARALFEQKVEEATGVDIQFVDAPSDYNDSIVKQTTLLSSGDSSIDIFYCDEPMFATFMNAGFLEPITDVMEPYKADFPAAYLESMCTMEGDIYGVTTEIQPVMLYVNRELFEAAGLEYPTNEEEFVHCAQTLTQGDVYGYGGSWAKGFLCSEFQRFVYSFGGDFFDWTNPNTQKAIQFMYDCINTYGITPVASLGDDHGAMNQKMIDGKYAMMFQWQYVSGVFKNAGVYEEDGFIEVIPMPTFSNNGSITGGWFWVLNKHSVNKDAAKKVLDYLASPAGQEAYGVEMSMIPSNSKALDSVELQKSIVGLDSAMQYIKESDLLPRPTHANINEIVESTETILHMYFTNEIDLETCVENGQAEIDRLINS